MFLTDSVALSGYSLQLSEIIMGEVNFVIVLALVTFGLVALWMWRSKKNAEKGLPKDKRH